MFGYKGRKKELQELKEAISKEKQELLNLKEIMETNHTKIDITYVYVFVDNQKIYIVKYVATPIKARLFGGKGPIADGYESKLIDIFTNKVVYKKTAKSPIKRKETVFENEELTKFHYAEVIPISEKEPTLLAYIDKQVPLYVLQRLYYKLNNIDLSSNILTSPNKGVVKTLKKQ